MCVTDRVLEPYERGLELIREAQEKPQCVFELVVSGVDDYRVHPHLMAAMDVLRVLDLKIFRELQRGEQGRAIEYLKILLRLSRDVRPEGDSLAQVTAENIEHWAFEQIVPRFLSTSGLKVNDCDRLLAILSRHRKASDIDPVLAAERYEQLFWRKLLYQIEHDQFDPARTAEEFELRVDLPTAGTVLIPILTQVYSYNVDRQNTRRIAADASEDNPKAARLLEQIEQNPEANRKLDRVVAGMAVTFVLGRMSELDFAIERRTLDRRYAQVERIRRREYPGRVADLEKLDDRWTLDFPRESPKLIGLFEPYGLLSLAKQVQGSDLLLGVTQCLTAAKRWEIENGEPPEDLAEAVDAAGLPTIPLDPNSGRPLQWRAGEKPCVYSPETEKVWRLPETVGEQELIRVSEATTHITKPLDKAGFVDYIAAANERASQGVTPENNFEVVVRRVMGPPGYADETEDKYFQMLGIPALSDEGDYYVDYHDFLEQRELPEKRHEELLDAHRRLYERPWTAENHPLAAEWMKSVEHQLDAIVEGSRRPHYYTPYVSAELDPQKPYPRMMNVLLASAQQQRKLSRALAMRAMFRLGQGQLKVAWSDLQAVHRIARHAAGGETPIEMLVGTAAERVAFKGDLQVLNSLELTDAQAVTFFEDIANLPDLPRLRPKLDLAQRHTELRRPR